MKKRKVVELWVKLPVMYAVIEQDTPAPAPASEMAPQMGRARGPACSGDGFGGEGGFLARDRQASTTITAMIVRAIQLSGRRERCSAEPGTALNTATISIRARITTMSWAMDLGQLGGGFGFSPGSFSIRAMEERYHCA